MDFHSDRLPIAERAAGYEAALHRYLSEWANEIRVQVTAPCPETFVGSLRAAAIGGLPASLHRSNLSHRVHWKGGVSCGGTLDFHFLMAGQISFLLDNGPVRLSAGDILLLPSRAEYRSLTQHFEMLAVGIPEKLLGCEFSPDFNCRIGAGSAFSGCIGALLREACGTTGGLSGTEGDVLETTIVDAIRLWTAGKTGALEIGLSSEESRLDDLKAIALRHLQISGLTPESLAKEAGISLRTVHRLFQTSGTTFRTWVRNCRLERCWTEITDPGQGKHDITAVARRWGFSDLRTFNRAFTERYGMSPAAARQRRCRVD